MDLKNSVVVLTQQAAMVFDYAMIVAAIAVVIFCVSILLRSRIAEQLRQTGERHDNLQMSYFNPSQNVVVQRPEEPDENERNRSRPAHRWRSSA